MRRNIKYTEKTIFPKGLINEDISGKINVNLLIWQAPKKYLIYFTKIIFTIISIYDLYLSIGLIIHTAVFQPSKTCYLTW